jgi:hypothetical protein
MLASKVNNLLTFLKVDIFNVYFLGAILFERGLFSFEHGY